MLRYAFQPALGADARPQEFANFARGFKGLVVYLAPAIGPEAVAVEADYADSGTMLELLAQPIRTTFGMYFAGRA